MRDSNSLRQAIAMAAAGRLSWEDVTMFHISDLVARDRDTAAAHRIHKRIAARRVAREGTPVSKRKPRSRGKRQRGGADAALQRHAASRAVRLAAMLALAAQGRPLALDEWRALLPDGVTFSHRGYHTMGYVIKRNGMYAIHPLRGPRDILDLLADPYVSEELETKPELAATVDAYLAAAAAAVPELREIAALRRQ